MTIRLTSRASVSVAAVALLVASCTSASPEPSSSPTSTTGEPTASETTATPTPEPEHEPELGSFGVSAGHSLAAEAGAQMLRTGGTAVDAAIAAAFADAVVQPASSGIGGGGASIVLRDGEAVNLDYREVVNQTGQVPAGGAGIAGFVAGMHRLHEQYGVLPWDQLLQPAITAARTGVPVSRYLASSINSQLGQRVLADVAHFHRPDGQLLQEGDLLVQEELAQTMEIIASEGASTFYTGALADRMVADVVGYDYESLAQYAVVESAPASGPVGNYTVLSGAPALPGAAIIQMMQIAQAAGIGQTDPDSAAFVDLQSQAWVIANESVQTLFGDPAFVDVPIAQLTDPALNAQLAAEIADPAQAVQDSANQPEYEGAANTTHISVVDADGVAISMTNTITNYWGSGQYVAGFFMNDQLTRFRAVGTADANVPAPGRRSVTWSSPTMVVDNQQRPVLVIGTPGGGQIPNTTATVTLRWALFGQSLEQAVAAPRFILTDGTLRLESDALRPQLEQMGYTVQVAPESSRANYGSVQAIAIDWDTLSLSSYADTRRSAGYVIEAQP